MSEPGSPRRARSRAVVPLTIALVLVVAAALAWWVIDPEARAERAVHELLAEQLAVPYDLGSVSFGIAGAYPASGLAVGDVAVATRVRVLDEGLETPERFVPFSRPGMEVPGAVWIPTDPELRSALIAGPENDFRVLQGPIATVSVCAGTERLAREREADGVLAEAMEGAAVALVAGHHEVPFVEVRGISNPCGPREGTPFDLAGAVANASRVLARLAGGSA